MSPKEKRLWLKAQRRAANLFPDLNRSILRAFAKLKTDLPERELSKLIEQGYLDKLIDDAQITSAFEPVSTAVQEATSQAAKQFSKDLNLSASFNVLNPDVITVIRDLDTKVVVSLTDDVRETVRAFVENGLRDGDPSASIARDLRNVIGLTSNQLEQSQTYRDKLAEKFDDAKVDKMVSAYEKKRIAQNAETIARTASLDAMKAGQKLSIQSAVDQGIYDESRLWKRWRGVRDDRERDEHWAMEDEEQPYDASYSNGEDTPGESTWNCRCLSIFFQKAA